MVEIKEVPNERWKLAQEAERKLWKGIPNEYIQECSKYYIKKADFLTDLLSRYKKINSKTKFLQIGCACTDIINYLKFGKKYSIDPLADFYKSKFNLDYKESNLISGIGEKLPYPDKSFDVVILANVLDHTQNPLKVLSEINRVLKKDGLLYFENHFYQRGFLVLSFCYSNFRKLFSREVFNVCHPHMFSLSDLKKIVSRDFQIVREEEIGKDIFHKINNLKELREKRSQEKFTRKIPAIFGLLGNINFTCLCQKKV